MAVLQGQIYWVELPDQENIGKGIVHPHVVVQADELNGSRIATTVVCALSTNLEKVQWPGNVLLEPGEGNLPRQSIILVSQVSVVDKDSLQKPIGSLADTRVREILAGMELQNRMREGKT